MRPEEIKAQAERVYPASYTENWEDKQSAFQEGAEWILEESVLSIENEELKEKIEKLEDNLWNLEYEKDKEIKELREEVENWQSDYDQLQQNTEV